jgi:hypothetical protein
MASFATLGSNLPGGGKFGIIVAILAAAGILHSIFKSTNRNGMESKVRSIRTNLVESLLMRTVAPEACVNTPDPAIGALGS